MELDPIVLELVNIKGRYFLGLLKGEQRMVLTLACDNPKDARASTDSIREVLDALIENPVLEGD
jgi:hypothetical protein